MPWTGMRGHLQREGWLCDGSFEHQAGVCGDTYIPSIAEYLPTTPLIVNGVEWSGQDGIGWQKIYHANALNLPQFGTANWWIQAGVAPSTNPRWVISNGAAYPDEPGYKGEWSAAYTFGDNPESPWLIPIRASAEFNPWDSIAGLTDEQVEAGTWTMTFESYPSWIQDSMSSGWFQQIAGNPRLSTATIVGHAFSDQPITLETEMRWWDFAGATPPSYIHTLRTDTKSFDVGGGAWTEFKFVCSTPPEYWPNWPNTVPNGNADYCFLTYKVRAVGGQNGQTVYLDNFWGWPDLTTADSGLLTVGVAEWIKDERDMYIGAHLWFKTAGVGNTPPNEPCDETMNKVIPSMTIDFEDFEAPVPALNTTDPTGFLRDPWAFEGKMRDPQGVLIDPTYPIVQFYNPTGAEFVIDGDWARERRLIWPTHYWKLATVAPDTGTRHLSLQEGGTTQTNAGLNVGVLQLFTGLACPTRLAYTTFVEGGQTVSCSVRARVSQVIGTAGSLFIRFIWETIEPWRDQFVSRSPVVLTTSYQTISFQAVVPAGYDHVLIQIHTSHGGAAANAVAFYVDNISWTVT